MYIQLDSQVLYYEKRGEGRPLIMLHGNSEDHTIFDPLARKLENHFTLYLLDSRGHGESSPANEYHYSDMARDVANLISTQELNAPAILGFSDGAVIAMLLSGRRMAQTGPLILCGGNLTPKGISWGERHKIKKHYRKTKDPLYKMMLEEPDLTTRDLARIDVPALVIAGENDIIKEDETKLIASSIPKSQLKIISGADHAGYIVQNDLLYDDVVSFLSK